ncbi:hypothetical protein [Halomonas sp. C05BenzN]|uniref:hypothetical protein n=1 Tax=Halomonas sp. C05BenzN TaxID=3411041 RepID=UPI003B92C973
MGVNPTAERLSLMLGLAVLMLATVPRYLAGGHETRLMLILAAVATVVVVSLFHWRLLGEEARARLPGLLGRLGLSLLAGLAGMGIWHALFTDWIGWELLVAHGATLGLLLHALWLWWKAPGARH